MAAGSRKKREKKKLNIHKVIYFGDNCSGYNITFDFFFSLPTCANDHCFSFSSCHGCCGESDCS